MLRFLGPRQGRYVKKLLVSDLVLTAATIKMVKMLCYTVFTVHMYTKMFPGWYRHNGTSPGATINTIKL